MTVNGMSFFELIRCYSLQQRTNFLERNSLHPKIWNPCKLVYIVHANHSQNSKIAFYLKDGALWEYVGF